MRRDVSAYEARYRMVTVEEAARIILATTPVLAAEEAELHALPGRVLAEDLAAPHPLPAFRSSAVDGFAVIASDDASSRQVLEEVTAGRVPTCRVERGTAVRVMTGAPLPEGADAVVMVEHAVQEGDRVRLQQTPRAGQNFHAIGQDVAAGQTVLTRGTALGAPEIGLLATLGIVRARVYRQPVVAVLSTGDELVEPGAAVPPGAIRDSNRFSLMTAAIEAGAKAHSLGIARDREDELTAGIERGLEEADVVLTSAGVSIGDRDFIKDILDRLGQIHFGRVALKPGKPLTYATVGARRVFGLPGFPVSSLVTFEIFVRPALLKMQGLTEVERPAIEVVLAHDTRRTPDRTEYQRAVVRWEDGRALASTTGLQASSRLLSMAGANALLHIPPGEGIIPAGSPVRALLLGPLRTGGPSA